MLRKLPATLLLILLFGTQVRATHISGGEIYYHCLGGDQYRITLVVYRDCAGINLKSSYQLDVQSPCGNTTLTVSTPGGTEISQLCSLQLPNSTCNGGTLPGIQQYIYTGTVTLPPCNSWTISWTEQWRNGAIANLVQPGNKNVYIEAKLNNVQGPCNHSPQFTNTAIPYVCAGYPISYSYGAFDPEGDSLRYTFISAMNTGAVPLPYVGGFSGTQPITGITLDPQSGQVNFTLNQTGNWVVVVRVDQYDAGGQWIGSVMRDMQFIAYPCTNIPPDPATGVVSALTGQATQTGLRSVQICESGNFCFDAVIADPNTSDVLTVTSNIAQNLPGATLTTSGTNPITVHVCWSGVANASGFYPFIITANDGACPIPALQTYVYSIHVLPGLIMAAPDIIDESCAGNGDGSALVNVSVGTPPYQYNWSTGDTTADIVAGAGNYQVQITDGNGCVAGPLDVVIGEANQPGTANGGPDLVICHGALPVALHGTVTNAPGGTWSGGNGVISGADVDATYMPTAAELAAGGVSLYLTTSGESPCGPAQDTVHLSFSTSFLHAGITSSSPACPGEAGGMATVTPGLPGYTFLWNDPSAQTTAVASGLLAGTYSVTVTAPDGCDTSLTTTISAPAPLSISSLDVTDEPCAGAGGGILAHVVGGTAPYQFQWSNGDTTASMQAGAGTYTLTITDAHGCTPVQASATIHALAQPALAHAGPDLIACPGSLPVQLNGSVTNATGGQWSGGNGTFLGTGLQPTYMPTAAELQAHGVELVLTALANNGCPPGTDTVHVALPTSFQGAGITWTDATCNGTSSGTASFSPANASFTFLWNDPSAQATAMATGLAEGQYTVTATDPFGCDTALSVSIHAPAAISLLGLAVVDEQCAGNGDGSITATVNGGTQPYQYQWSNGATSGAIQAGAGTYSLSVTDAQGCAPAQGSATILALGQPNIAHAGADTLLCNWAVPVQLHGAILHAAGGVWSGGTGSFSGPGLQPLYLPSMADVLAHGATLVLTTTGNSTCPPGTDTLHIAIPASFLGAAVGSTGLACADDHSGSAAFTPDSPGFTFLWSDPLAQATATANGLGAGSYTVHVADGHGCDTTATVLVTQPTPLSAALLTGMPPTCAGGNNGTATVAPGGGTPGYSYAWGGNAAGQATATVNNISAGVCTVTVTDAHGCQASASITLAAPPPITLTASVADTVCVNSPMPLVAQASGGTGTLVVTWAGIGTGDSITHAFPASQTVHVSVVDQAGCTGPAIDLPVTVLNLSQAVLATYGDTAFCPGGTATLGASLSGYPGLYTLSWPQLQTTGPGPFTVHADSSLLVVVSVTDGCANTVQSAIPVTVEIPPAIALPPVIAEGCAPLSVQFPAGPTTPPASYLWQFGDGGTANVPAPAHVFPAGTYTVGVTATTPLGCTTGAMATGQVIVHENPVAAFDASPWETDADHATVQFSDQSTGAIHTWDWNFGDGGSSTDPTPSHHFTGAGTWTVSLSVIDGHGCTGDATRTVNITPVYDITIPNAFSPNPHGGSGGAYDPADLGNDVFYPFIRFVKDFRMRIYNRWGELVYESDDIKRGWDGYYRGQLSPQDVYVYQVWVRWVDDREAQRTGDLTLFR